MAPSPVPTDDATSIKRCGLGVAQLHDRVAWGRSRGKQGGPVRTDHTRRGREEGPGANGHVQARGADGRGRCTPCMRESATSAQEPAARAITRSLPCTPPHTRCSRNELALATELQGSGPEGRRVVPRLAPWPADLRAAQGERKRLRTGQATPGARTAHGAGRVTGKAPRRAPTRGLTQKRSVCGQGQTVRQRRTHWRAESNVLGKRD